MGRLASVPLAATTVVADDFHQQVDGLTPAYNEIARWIEANGYGTAGPPREIFAVLQIVVISRQRSNFPLKKWKHSGTDRASVLAISEGNDDLATINTYDRRHRTHSLISNKACIGRNPK